VNPPQADTFEATVVAELPQQLYRLEAEFPQSQSVLTASLSTEARRIGMHIRTGQRVLVRRASLDPGRGVITGLATRQP
jgi:ActR/RegA family two-component response regulator